MGFVVLAVHASGQLNRINWIKVTFLSDLFDKLNSLNLSLQAPSKNITVSSKLKLFGEKLMLWQSKITKGVIDCFPIYNKYASNKELIPEILFTLIHLQSTLQHYFPTVATKNMDGSAIRLKNMKLQNLQLKKSSSLI